MMDGSYHVRFANRRREILVEYRASIRRLKISSSMKIIHTSDWHLGSRLYNYDRTDEEEHFFRQLASVVERERPDALVVSGDVYHTGAPGNDVAKRFTERLVDVVGKCPGMETVVIAGNHDSYSRLVVDEALWRRFHVHVFGRPSEDGDGRALFGDNVVDVPGKGVIAAVPFIAKYLNNRPRCPFYVSKI